jgi:PAS domain S-box-containing protein
MKDRSDDREDVVRLREQELTIRNDDRQRTDAELRLFKLISDHAADAYTLADDTGRLIYVNRAACRMSGYSEDELLEMSVLDFEINLTRGRFAWWMRQPDDEPLPLFETALQRKDGSTFPAEVSVTRVFFDGRPYMFSIARDITERKRAEEQLRESEARFRTLSEAAPALIWFDDAEGKCRFVNRQFLDFFGKRLEEVHGTGWHPLLHPEEGAEYIADFLDAVGKRRSFHNRVRAMRFDGQWRWIESHAEPIFAADGKFLGHVGITEDITERKQIEQERELLLAEERRLREAAEAHNRAKDEFLAIVSHELRSPLNAILGYARLIRARPGDTVQVRHHGEIIERNAKAQQQLIEDLLDTARIISGNLRIEVQPADLRLVLEEAFAVAQPAAAVKNIHFVAHLGSGQQKIIGDPARLQQVVWNLLQNAIKFTPEGGRVELRMECSRSNVRISVSDTGRGIAPEFLPSVFDRFTQQDASHTRRHGGLGLGLALVKQLVELHGGTIEAASEGVGRGATFTVTLPLRAPEVEMAAPQPPAVAEVIAREEAIAIEEIPSLGGIRVLALDDREEARHLLTTALTEYGATVTAVSTGTEALAILAGAPPNNAPHVLILDIEMPDEDGYTVLRRVRALEAERGAALSQRIPAVALTAHARTEDRLRALAAGFRMHIAKPVEIAELVVVVASLVGERGEGARLGA